MTNRIQYNPIQSNSIQSNPIQSNPTQSNPIKSSYGDLNKLFIHSLQITRMKVIAGSGMAAFNFTIDGHHMWILKLDGSPVVPTKVNEFLINAAQRVDIAVCRKSKS